MWTILIEGSTPDTPITIARRNARGEDLVDREVVGWRSAGWQTLGDGAETVTDWDGTADELAAHVLANQTLAVATEESDVRVRVWHGTDADTGTTPAAEASTADLLAD